MGKNSSIEWTHHTFNPWWGCVKVSPACKHCYAEAWAKRVGQGVWGKRAPRRTFSEAHWLQPLAWNREALAEGLRKRVFCASMADVFEERRDLDPWRERLWGLIEATPQLDWLLLTKRSDAVGRLAPWSTAWPANVWIGTTIENQHWADKRLEEFANLRARVRFLSCEPLLGPLDLTRWLDRLSWVITGGESGPRARPMHPLWVEGLRDQCSAAGVPFHFKQWGDWRPVASDATRTIRALEQGGVRVVVERLGKREAGRVLSGRTWDELPV